MNFSDLLNKYLKEFNCSSKKLSELTNISPSVISRYRSNQRTPEINSVQTQKIIEALTLLSNNKYQKEDIEKEIINSLKKDDFNYDNFSKNLNELINVLKINLKDMSKYTSYDSSHISRIRYSKAKPSEPIEFAKKVTNYITNKYTSTEDIKKLTDILNINDLTKTNLQDELLMFLINNKNLSTDKIENFLTNLDNFNLNDYIKAIKFDELKIPNIPFYITKTKNYYGLEEMKKGELDFFKGTVLTKNKNVFMCSDMPMEDLAKDIEFGKKWMFGIACMLKKGIHLNIIHNLDRPFNEMMLGLESWIPIYMTGQISPYYLNSVKNNVYNHLNYVSGVTALTGECIKGYHNKGMYYLSTNKNEVKYYKEKCDLLLKKAKPLMEIYRENNQNEYELFLKNDENINGNRKRFLSSLPIFTITDELLKKILKRNKVSKLDIEKIIKYKNSELKYMNNILKNNSVNDYIYIIKENENITLSLENMFYDKKINYTYDEYLEHLKLTKKFEKENINYHLNYEKEQTFKNITTTIINNKYVIISKNANPAIHFIIKHPKLVEAIDNFNPLVKE